MDGRGGLNRSLHGAGLVQFQTPTVSTPAAQTGRIAAAGGRARANMPAMDLVAFPECARHGPPMDTDMRDLAAARSRPPWDGEVRVKDGTSCGLRFPTRACGGSLLKEASE